MRSKGRNGFGAEASVWPDHVHALDLCGDTCSYLLLLHFPAPSLATVKWAKEGGRGIVAMVSRMSAFRVRGLSLQALPVSLC